LVGSPDGSAVLIYGGLGVGKTMLAGWVANLPNVLELFGARRWMVKLETISCCSAAISEIALRLGLPANANITALQEHLPSEGPALLALDGLEGVWHADRARTEDLIQALRSIPGVSLIVSLRGDGSITRVNWDKRLRLQPLGEGDAKKLFLDIADNVDQDDPDLPFLLDRSDGNPLALYLTASRAAAHVPLSRIRRIWEAGDPDVIRELHSDGIRDRDLRASVEFSLKKLKLGAAGHRLATILGQFPAGVAESDLEELEGRSFHDAFAQLSAVGLLVDREGRFDLLSPVREIVAGLDVGLSADELKRWAEHYVGTAHEHMLLLRGAGDMQAYARLVTEFPNIAASSGCTLESAAWITPCMLLLDLSWAIRVLGAPVEPMKRAIGAIRIRHSNDAMSAFRELANAQFSLFQGHQPKAFGLFEKARNSCQRTGLSGGEAVAVLGLASIAARDCDTKMATHLYAQAQRLADQTGVQTFDAHCLLGLAELLFNEERYHESKALYERAQVQCYATRWITGEMHCLHRLAHIALRLNDDDKARNILLEVRKRYPLMPSPFLEATCLVDLGDVAASPEEANEFYLGAEALFKKAGRLDRANKIACKVLDLFNVVYLPGRRASRDGRSHH
jgi:tetratricopeptide (TPR) repeat protein